MKNYHSILVGLDFSDASRAALRAAVRLASYSGATLTALHVLDPHFATELKKAHGLSDDQLLKKVHDRVEAFMEATEVGTELVKVEVDVGHVFLSLIGACERHQADLLILGTRGTEHEFTQIGAVAAKCVRKAPADVLLVRENTIEPFRKVLACVDFSETSAKAVRAARLIAENDHAGLDCLVIYQSALALSMDYGGFVPPLPVDERQATNVWKRDLDEFVQPLLRTSEGLDWKTSVVEYINIREGIIDHIKAEKIDLVVLGTRGKTDLRTLLMGTTAEKVVTHAPCSILAVKPENFEPPIRVHEVAELSPVAPLA